MQNIKVSVIIPIYKVEEFLEECLDSVVNQTLKGIEVIMVDDGSPDGSSDIAKHYADKYSNFVYVRQENGGLGNARNTGVRYANGEYIAFLDSDDVVTEYAYEKLYYVAHERNKDVVTGKVIRFNSDGEFRSQLHDIAFQNFGVDTNIYENNNLLYDTTAWNKLIRRSFWLENNFEFPEGMLYEDIPVIIPMYCQTRSVGMIHDVCYKWRARDGKNKSITQLRSDLKNIEDRLKALKMVDTFFESNIFDEKLTESKWHKWLYLDMKLFINQCLETKSDNFISIMSLMNEYVKDSIPEKTIFGLPVLMQEMFASIKKGDYERVKLLREYELSGYFNKLKISEINGKIVGYFPENIVSDTPADLENNLKMQGVRQRIQKIKITDEKCVIDGYALVSHIETTESKPEKLQAYLYSEENDVKIPVKTEVVKSDDAQKRFGMAEDGATQIGDYTYSGYRITVNIPKDIIANHVSGDVKILIAYNHYGIKKEALLAGSTKKFREKLKSNYGAVGDYYISFKIQTGDFLIMNVTDKPAREPELAMHSLFTRLKKTGSRFTASGICLHRFKDEKGKELAPEKVNVFIGNNERCGKLAFSNSKGISLSKGIKLNRYTISFDEADLVNLDIQNKVQLKYGNVIARIGYNIFDRSKGRYKTSRIFNCGDLACYLKQSVYNGMYLTVREPQIYDEPVGRFRSLIAWIAANFWFKNGIIFMYEKECSRYQESASVLYEKLIDEGYTNVYFVVNEDSPEIHNLEEKYRKNLIYKDSFRHLLYFFKSKVFISSETMSHAMQLRASDKRIAKKTDSKDIAYVFLQHGVMYMVSLNADLRVSFRQKGLNLYRVVVSSELEAKHFIDFAGFEKEELYVTGLATFDKSVRYEDADKIVIMPTWRRWENSQARQEFTKTGYYRMIKRMVDAVPEKLRERIIILPHPLMQQAMNNSENELSKYMATETHDNILKRCDLLITDYSSIAYDAYYRGCNVIFYWEEKDACMKQYGPETTLMLTEEKAFGDICNDAAELRESIQRWYGKKQNEEYNRKYRDIVTYHDNRNSERIIDLLKQDGVL